MAEIVFIDLNCSFLESKTSDLIIFVEKNKFCVNKEFLASKSDYFRALLFLGLKESSEKEIKLTGTTPEVFHSILKYLYTGQLDIDGIEYSLALKLLSTCHEWLLSDVFDYLKKNRNQKINSLIFEVASTHNLQGLQKECLKYFDENAEQFLSHPCFLNLDATRLCCIIERDTFYAKEELIFEAVLRWSKEASKEDVNLLLKCIRFPLMNELYLLKSVAKNEIVDPYKILDAILTQREVNKFEWKFRGLYVCNENMIEKYGIDIKFKSGNKYDSDYSKRPKYEFKDIIIILKNPCFLNCIKIIETDFTSNFCGEQLSLSVDGKIWHKVKNEKGGYIYSFPERIVKYIKFSGVLIYRSDEELGIRDFEAFLKDPKENTAE